MVVDQTRVKTRSDSTHSVIVGIESSVAYCGMCILRTRNPLRFVAGLVTLTVRYVVAVNSKYRNTVYSLYERTESDVHTLCHRR